MLVIAGPGTGKTQLLSARVANILTKTDTLPQNILCLTFTESGAANMRERLSSFIGKEAYGVSIGTYHNFGSTVLRQYPEFITDANLERPIDSIMKKEVLMAIIDKLPYSSPLKSQKYSLGDLAGTISELKRGLLSPESVQKIADENKKQITQLSPIIADIFSDLKRMPGKLSKAMPYYTKTLKALSKYPTNSLAGIATDELSRALEQAAEDGSTKPLTKWKNDWLYKNSAGDFGFTRPFLNEKFGALAKVLSSYNQALDSKGLYDFDDMILRTIKALQQHEEFKLNLQEKYQYILLDEFQDTNAAQFEIVQLLSDNPVHEGRPNIMAVGDDDQAIYAFQGAKTSNMIDFANSYRNTAVVNFFFYFFWDHVFLHLAHNIAEQIESRLHSELEGVKKTLKASAGKLPEQAQIERHEFASSSEERSWIAEKVSELIQSGVEPNEIAVLAPKHKYLEAMVPYLNHKSIPVSYEKRENILNTPVVIQLMMMSNLLLAIDSKNQSLQNHLFPQVMSLPFFQIPISDIWKINWAVGRREENRSWALVAIEEDSLKSPVWLMLGLAGQLKIRTLEGIFDVLIGSEALKLEGFDKPLRSPLKNYYFSSTAKEENALAYYEALSHLSVIRSKIREHQASREDHLTLDDFTKFIKAYKVADEPLLNTHPIAQSESAVKLQTVYRAKGLEYEHVFLLSCLDSVWGNKIRGGSNRLSLPANIRHIRHAGDSEDERLRLLFVAITRSKQGLYLTSHSLGETGKETTPIKFFDERKHQNKTVSTILPQRVALVNKEPGQSLEIAARGIELSWNSPDTMITPTLKSLLEGRLAQYQMSPTHLNTFIDMEWGGPEVFLLNTLLKFPQAPGINGEFGSAIHASLEWYQNKLNSSGKKPTDKQAISYFTEDISRRYIPENEMKLLIERGRVALTKYLALRAQIFHSTDLPEQSFGNEGVFSGEAHLAGNIDRLEIDKENRQIVVVDYKTGSSYQKWKSDLKLLKYRQQLYFYKILVENSHTYAGYKVDEGRLEFIEPDENGDINTLTLTFQDQEMAELKKLITAVWSKIKNLDFPDTTKYQATNAGTKKFINDLLG